MRKFLNRIINTNKWTVFELIWLITFLFIATVITVSFEDSLIGYSVLVSGVFCVVLAAKGSLSTYFFGLYNSLAYGYISLTNDLYGEMALNFFFFTPMNIVGFILWRKHMSRSTVMVRRLSPPRRIAIVTLCILSTIGLGWILSLIPDQQSPYVDATTNVLSVGATFLMISRYKEQWWLYIALNVFTIVLWTLRLNDGSSDALLMITMWSAYLINAGYGYYRWNQLAETQRVS